MKGLALIVFACLQQAVALRGANTGQDSDVEVHREELLFAMSSAKRVSVNEGHDHVHGHNHGHGQLRAGGGQEGQHSASHRSHMKARTLEASSMGSLFTDKVGIVHKTEYWGKIQVGSPAQEFTVIFDTGSGNLIIPGSNCKSEACTSHKRYDPSTSSSSLQVTKGGKSVKEDTEDKKEASVKFGTGRIHGMFYKDKLCLGSACMNANFIATTQETEMPFVQCTFDGIMGLGFSDLSMGPGFNMVDDLTGVMSQNKFSVYLTDDGGSEINFGGYKRSQAASDMFWVPVNKESYWQIAIDDVTFNNVKTGLCSGCQVAVDTGTSLLAGPSSVVENLGTKLNVKDDCSNFDSLPMLGFAAGEKVLNLKPDDYIDKGSDGCSVSLMTLDVPPPKGPLFVFGDPFLRRFLTVYDRDGPQVGFAVASQPDMTPELASQLLATVGGSPGAAQAPLAADAGAFSDAPAAPAAPASQPDSPSTVDAETTTSTTTTSVVEVTTTTTTVALAVPSSGNSGFFASRDGSADQASDLTKIMDKLQPDTPASQPAPATAPDAAPATSPETASAASGAFDGLDFKSAVNNIENPGHAGRSEFDSWVAKDSAKDSGTAVKPADPTMSVDDFVKKWSRSITTGMLQVGDDESSAEDHLVSISLRRTKGRVTVPESF